MKGWLAGVIAGAASATGAGLVAAVAGLANRSSRSSEDPRSTWDTDEDLEDPWHELVPYEDEQGMHLHVPLAGPPVPLVLPPQQGGGIAPVAFYKGSYDRGKNRGPLHWHRAVDIRVPRHTPVLCPVGRGIIIDHTGGEQWSERAGWCVRVLDELTGIEHYMAHLSHRPWVEVGQIVTVGEVLGTAGNSGNAVKTKCHVHYQQKLHKPRKHYARYPNPYPLLRVFWPKNTYKSAAPAGPCIKHFEGCSQCLPRIFPENT